MRTGACKRETTLTVMGVHYTKKGVKTKYQQQQHMSPTVAIKGDLRSVVISDDSEDECTETNSPEQ